MDFNMKLLSDEYLLSDNSLYISALNSILLTRKSKKIFPKKEFSGIYSELKGVSENGYSLLCQYAINEYGWQNFTQLQRRERPRFCVSFRYITNSGSKIRLIIDLH